MSIASILLLLASAQGVAVNTSTQMTVAESDVAAQAYSKATGFSLETARQRLEVESGLDPHIKQLQEKYKDRLTYISIESQPDLHIRIGLKGSAVEPDQKLSVNGESVRVDLQEGYLYTREEFRQVVKKATPKIIELIPDATSINGRPNLNIIEIWVQGTNEKTYQRALEQIQKITGIKAQVVLGTVPSRNSAYAAGGAILTANGRMCTSGIAVKHKFTGEKGLITAAHCDDALIYSNYSQTAGGPQVILPLTFKEGMFDASHDVQWHTLPAGNVPEQAVFAEGMHEYETKALLTIWNEPPINRTVCFRGARSGFSCGTVTMLDHLPLGVCGAALCDNTWALIEGPDLACAAGDSGAAVFYIGSGYGIVKSMMNPSGSLSKGECMGLTVMPFGKVAALDLQPL